MANPGSDEALALGCKCPRMDNSYGRGVIMEGTGQPSFWVNDDCPLHSSTAIDKGGGFTPDWTRQENSNEPE